MFLPLMLVGSASAAMHYEAGLIRRFRPSANMADARVAAAILVFTETLVRRCVLPFLMCFVTILDLEALLPKVPTKSISIN